MFVHLRDSVKVSQFLVTASSSGSVGPNRVSTGFRRNPVLARWDPTGLDGSLDCPVLVHDCDVRTHTGPSGVPTGPPGPHRDPEGPRRTPGGTVGSRFMGASPVWAARSSYWRSRGYLYPRLGQVPACSSEALLKSQKSQLSQCHTVQVADRRSGLCLLYTSPSPRDRG